MTHYRFASIARCLFLTAIIAGLSGCGTEPTEGFEGVQLTFEDGRLAGTIGDASDDWQPATGNCLKPVPAAPNPVHQNVELSYELCRSADVRIWLESSPGVLFKTVGMGTFEAGAYSYNVDLSDAPAGIYRCYYSITHSGTTSTTYGDIKVEH